MRNKTASIINNFYYHKTTCFQCRKEEARCSQEASTIACPYVRHHNVHVSRLFTPYQKWLFTPYQQRLFTPYQQRIFTLYQQRQFAPITTLAITQTGDVVPCTSYCKGQWGICLRSIFITRNARLIFWNYGIQRMLITANMATSRATTRY